MFDTKKTLNSLQTTLQELLKQIEEDEKKLKAKIKGEMPEFVKDYEELMVSVWRGEKDASDISAWWAKYEHALKTKSAKNDLNKK